MSKLPLVGPMVELILSLPQSMSKENVKYIKASWAIECFHIIEEKPDTNGSKVEIQPQRGL
jgi:hypothetical protein